MMSSRQFRWALAVLAVSGLAGGVLSNWLLPKGAIAYAQEANTAQVVTAREFRLVDEAGNMRARLLLSEEGQPLLGFSDEAGELRAALGLFEDGRPRLGFSDEAGELRAEFGAGTVTLFNADGEVLWQAP